MLKDKKRIEELELQIKRKEEELERIKKEIEEIKGSSQTKQEIDNSAFDGLFEPYDYFANDK